MSRFNQLLQFFPRTVFHNGVEIQQSDRYTKSFRSWDLLVLMLYGQIRQVESLRTLITGFNSQSAHHYHLHTHKVKRSTCADALSKRSVVPFRLACEALLNQVSRRQRRSCEQLLCLIDSTMITLKGWPYDAWTAAHRTPTTQGLKVHVAMDPQQTAPTLASITEANVNDLTFAKAISITPGMTYIMDKAYCDYNWWHQLDSQGAFFVTRLKRNAKHQLIGIHTSPGADGEVIIADQVITLTNKYPGGGRRNDYVGKPLRKICVQRENQDEPLVIITNDFQRPAQAIADLYKQRWQIELLFKWLKQKLKLKRYFGYSENAVRIQIYCALITYLLMLLYNQAQRPDQSLSQLAIELRHGLLHRPKLDRYYYHKRKEKRLFIQNHQPLLPI